MSFHKWFGCNMEGTRKRCFPWTGSFKMWNVMVHRFPFLTPSACVFVCEGVTFLSPSSGHSEYPTVTSGRSHRSTSPRGLSRPRAMPGSLMQDDSTQHLQRKLSISSELCGSWLSYAPLIKRTNSRNASVTKSCPFSVHHVLVCCSRDVTETNISIMLLLEHNGAAYVRFISLTFAPKRCGRRTFCHPWQKMDDSPEWVTLKNGLCVHSRIYCLISSVLTTSFKRT